MDAYWDYLERHGVVKDGQELLVVEHNGYIGFDIQLRSGTLDNLYPDQGLFKGWVRVEWPRNDADFGPMVREAIGLETAQ